MSAVSHSNINLPGFVVSQDTHIDSKSTLKTSFAEKFLLAFQKGTTNKGHNPIIGFANLIGRIKRSSSNEEKKTTQITIQEPIPTIYNPQKDIAISQILPEVVAILNEVKGSETQESAPKSPMGGYSSFFLFDEDGHEATKRLRPLSVCSERSEDNLSNSSEFIDSDEEFSSLAIDVFKTPAVISIKKNVTNPLTVVDEKDHELGLGQLNENIQTEDELTVLLSIVAESFTLMVKSLIKLILSPFKIMLAILQFLIDFDDNMHSLYTFFMHSNNIMKQSDLFLTSINNSELVDIASKLMNELKEMSTELKILSFPKNIAKIAANSSKITEGAASEEGIKVLISKSLKMLTSINTFFSFFNENKASSMDFEAHGQKISEILNSLGIIVDDMVFKGPLKGLMGAWEKYRKERLESYEKLQTLEHFQEAAAKEARDLEVIFKRYYTLLDKAKSKGAPLVCVKHFNDNLTRLTENLHKLQSQIIE